MFQKAAIIIALASSFALALGMEIWNSTTPHVPTQTHKSAGPVQVPQKETAEDAIARYNKYLDFFTAILAIATVGLGIATAGLYVGGRRELRHLEDTAQRQLRAYVSANPNFMHAFSENEHPRARFLIQNVGTTPAHSLRHRANILVVPNPLRIGYSLPDISTELSPAVVVFRDLPMSGFVTAQTPFTAVDIAALIAGTSQICIYGEIFYEDAFGVHHVTRFCSLVRVNQDTMTKLTSGYGPSDLQVSFEAAPMGNNAT